MGHYQSESRYYLHVQLMDIEPPIWRKIVVPGAISLHTPHTMLQVVMGWVTPRCLAGKRACPPADAGGSSGYALLLEALQNSNHPEHAYLRRWAGAFYDLELFSVQQANSALAVLD